MKQKGRPKSINTRAGRIRTIILSEQAELLIRTVTKKRDLFDFSRYVSEHIVADFGGDEYSYLKHQLSLKQKEADKLYKEINSLVEMIRYNQNQDVLDLKEKSL
jgi:hypothetical protein